MSATGRTTYYGKDGKVVEPADPQILEQDQVSKTKALKELKRRLKLEFGIKANLEQKMQRMSRDQAGRQLERERALERVMINILKESPDMFGFEARRLDKMLKEHAILDF